MLTREEALRKHREMWEAMYKALGDNPTLGERTKFKIEWCEQHDRDYIHCHCYLCQYTYDHGLSCKDCPIDWGNEPASCIGKHADYGFSPLHEILALPERKVDADE